MDWWIDGLTRCLCVKAYGNLMDGKQNLERRLTPCVSFSFISNETTMTIPASHSFILITASPLDCCCWSQRRLGQEKDIPKSAQLVRGEPTSKGGCDLRIRPLVQNPRTTSGAFVSPPHQDGCLRAHCPKLSRKMLLLFRQDVSQNEWKQ